jgi:hypothetical protein
MSEGRAPVWYGVKVWKQVVELGGAGQKSVPRLDIFCGFL